MPFDEGAERLVRLDGEQQGGVPKISRHQRGQ
jgi:hypothetical protein